MIKNLCAVALALTFLSCENPTVVRVLDQPQDFIALKIGNPNQECLGEGICTSSNNTYRLSEIPEIPEGLGVGKVQMQENGVLLLDLVVQENTLIELLEMREDSLITLETPLVIPREELILAFKGEGSDVLSDLIIPSGNYASDVEFNLNPDRDSTVPFREEVVYDHFFDEEGDWLFTICWRSDFESSSLFAMAFD